MILKLNWKQENWENAFKNEVRGLDKGWGWQNREAFDLIHSISMFSSIPLLILGDFKILWKF